MTPDRWQQIDHLFHETLACEPRLRESFLAAACEHDEALRVEIESLLSSHHDASEFIETPAGDVAAELLGSRPATFESGQKIENYRIVKLLGAGGMGEVYLADDTRLNRKVALKLLPPHFTSNPDRVRRFEREARAASALNHPNIVTIYEIGKSASVHFIATEFVDGKTLRQLINEKPFKLSETLNIAIQVAGALVGAHAAGIVHRDIKPENIMVRADGYAKILDFGLAKLTERQPSYSETETPTLLQSTPGMVMGTVQYMSPEQARGKKVDARSDIWSLGVLLYELLAGRVPFNGETPSHVMVSLMEDELPALDDYPNVPAQLARIVSRTLRKNLKERYQTSAELVRDLREFKRELQVEALLQQPAVFDKTPAAPTKGNGVAARATSPKGAALGTVPLEHLSSAEYIVRGISQHKRAFALAAVVLLITVTASGYFFFGRNNAVKARSLAVLPFSNAGNNADLEYLSDGLSESLTNNLSPIPGLSVIARYSSFQYKGKPADPQEVGKSLGVDAIVTGSVNKVGDNYLISVELVSASDRKHIWGNQYNRKSGDLLMVQSEISREIAEQLRLRLTQAEEQELTKSQAINPQAYDLFLKARALRNTGKTENRKKAIDYYQQAIAVEPGYGLAYAEMAGTYSGLITNNELPQKEYAPKAAAAAQKAVELGPSLAEAHLALGNIKMNQWDWPAAEAELKRALELNQNLLGAIRSYAWFLRIHGRVDEAAVEFNRARDLDPLAKSSRAARAGILGMYRQNDQALEAAKEVLQLDPNDPGAHISVGGFYARLGRNREAIASYLEAVRLGDDSGDIQGLLAWAYAADGQRDKATEILKKFETGQLYSSPVGVGMIYLALGDKERFYAALEDAYAMHDQQLIYLRGAWEFDAIRSEPRFQDLMRRVGL